MRTKHAVVLAVVTVVLLAAALLAAGRLRTDKGDGADANPAVAAGSGGNETGGDGVVRASTPRLAAPGARSVAYEGLVADVRQVSLVARQLRMLGTVVDAAGARLGQGTLVADGQTTIEGPGLRLDGAFTFAKGAGRVTNTAGVAVDGHATISAASLSFVGPGAAQGRPVRGPIRLEDPSIDVDEGATLAGETLQLSKGGRFNRATLSWAGGGRLEVPGHRPFAGEWLGVKAKKLAASLRLADLSMQGEFDPQQVYVDGMPQLRADKVGVDLVTSPPPVAPGGRGEFDWAPRNRSGIDMTITGIRPGNEQARWVNLALDRMPPMFGGENKVPPGGNTSGLAKRGGGLFGGGASPIDAVILPGTADQEGITFDVPATAAPGRYELVLVVEGNFDPITVTIPFEVVAPQPAT